VLGFDAVGVMALAEIASDQSAAIYAPLSGLFERADEDLVYLVEITAFQPSEEN